jgi:preprotein translocase subunit SecD
MDRKIKWRLFWLTLITIVAVCMLVPSLVPSQQLPDWFSSMFSRKVQLGLDLQGGLQIFYRVDAQKAVDDKASEIKRDIDDRLSEDKLEATVKTPIHPVGAVDFTASSPATLETITKKYLADYDEVLVERTCPSAVPANTKCYRVSSEYADGIKESALEQAIKTVRERVNDRGVAEPSVVRKEDGIIVELPGLDEAAVQRVKTIIKRTAKLEFKIVDNDSEYMKKLFRYVSTDQRAKELGIEAETEQWVHDESGERFADSYLSAADRTENVPLEDAKARGCYNPNKAVVRGRVECLTTGRQVIEAYLAGLIKSESDFKPDDNHQIAYESMSPERADVQEDVRWRTVYLHRAVELGGSAISQADVVFNPTTTRPEVLITFNRYGGRRFGELTSKNVGRKMAIILDDRVNSAPVIQSAITGGRSTITMGGSDIQVIQREAEDLVAVLRTGALPAPLQEEYEANLGPTLGRDAVDKAQFSFILGSVLVVLIMMWVYRFSGLISIVALVLNLLLMMAVLAALGADLTLPGIAALVLTVGMAVDANIIIYERIREELRAGKSVRGAVDAGFSRGFSAIVDGQLTTAVAGLVLYNYGSGPIQGFATMLLIGIGCTLFTATWCTRLFFELYVGRGRKAATIAI